MAQQRNRFSDLGTRVMGNFGARHQGWVFVFFSCVVVLHGFGQSKLFFVHCEKIRLKIVLLLLLVVVVNRRGGRRSGRRGGGGHGSAYFIQQPFDKPIVVFFFFWCRQGQHLLHTGGWHGRQQRAQQPKHPLPHSVGAVFGNVKQQQHPFLST